MAARAARGSRATLGTIDTETPVDSRQLFPRKQRDVEPAASVGGQIAYLASNTALALGVLAVLAPDSEPIPEDV